MCIVSRSFLKYQLPLYIYIVCIFAQSSIPGKSMPSTEFQIDKLAHFVEYGILSFLLFRAIFSSRRLSAKSTAMLSVLFAIALGALEETYQGFSGRSSSVYDWLFDLIGAAATAGFLVLCMRVRRAQE